MLKILSIDGGGIRGIVPAVLLAELERRTGQPIARLFHLIAGTSTGGLITFALTCPGPDGAPRYSATQLVGIYEREGPVIFARSLWRRIVTLCHLLGPQYSTRGTERVLAHYLGETRLGQALVDVLVPTYDIERHAPVFFKSRKAQPQPGDFLMRDIARATAAAPTYFPPVRLALPGGADQYYALIDGGVAAANPALCAFAEAKRFHPEADVLLVSLGTGELTEPVPYARARHWGLIGWARPVLRIVLDGPNEAVDYQLRQLLPDVPGRPRRYYRFEAPLTEAEDAIDNASAENIRLLKQLADTIIRENTGTFDDLARQLLQA